MSKQSARGLVRARWVVLTLIAVAAVVFAVGPAKSFIHHDDARTVSVARVASQPAAVTPATRARVNASFAALPLAFEANQGQTDPQVKYMARGNGYKLYLTSSEAVLTLPNVRASSEVSRMIEDKRLGPAKVERRLRKGVSAKVQQNSVAVLRMHMLRSNPKTRLIAEDQQVGKINYLIGKDSSKWHSNIPLFGRVTYRDVYPGVDLAFHGVTKQLEFDYLVSPGADPGLIALGFAGADKTQISADGDLILSTATGPVQVHRPFAYQEMNGSRQKVDARFVAKGGSEFSFALGAYDPSRQLVIDPAVTYSTYFGGNRADYGLGITVDTAGNAFVTGASDSDTLPGNGGPTSGFDVFVTEISSSGPGCSPSSPPCVVFTTLFGGSADDFPGGIAVDSTGIYVAGTTDSADFPVTPGAAQGTFQGGGTNGKNDAFAIKLDFPVGATIAWSTYIGGNDSDSGLAIAVDTNHDAYVVGETFSPNLPVVTSLPKGGALNGKDDGFIAKIHNASGTATSYSLLSYIGGSSGDLATGVALDGTGTGNIYISGETISVDLPVTLGVVQNKCGTDGLCNNGVSGAQDDAFVVSIKADLSGYNYVTYYGGSGADDALDIAVDKATGDSFITGDTFSSDFPLAGTPFQSSLSGTENAFVLQLNSTGSVANYATYLGGSGSDIGVGIELDSSGDAYVTGQTSSNDFPAPNALQTLNGNTDAFVSVLTPAGSSLLFSTFLGGAGDEDQLGGNIAVDSSQNIYVTGDTDSSDFPTKNVITGGGNYAGGTCLNSSNVSVPCPDAFVTAYTSALAPDFTITASALSPATVSPGSPATSAITIGSLNGYSKTANLSCSVSGGGTPAPTCSFSANSVAGGSGTSTLTVSTTGPTGALLHRSNIFYAMFLPLSGLALIGTGFSCGKSRRRKALGFLILYALLAALLLLPACGGGGSHTTPHGGTPAGNYTITVTGTDGTLTHPVSPALVLTVN